MYSLFKFNKLFVSFCYPHVDFYRKIMNMTVCHCYCMYCHVNVNKVAEVICSLYMAVN